MGTLPLFDEPSSFDREGVARKLTALARDDIWIGTSSWKYEGWIGQIYTEQNYLNRGHFSRKRFEAECLNEYARTFPIVCGDFSFYQFPDEAYWQRLFGSAPAGLKYAFKVPEEITVRMFPLHPRYGARAGEENPTFLDAALFRYAFLDMLLPYRDRIAVLVLEFGTFPKSLFREPGQFIEVLDPFLALLPRDFRFAVETRNQDFLVPEYFAALRRHRVAHVFNAWTRMPAIRQQMLMPEVFTSDFTMVRAQLRQGRPYAQAVEIFTPYREVRDQNPEVRQSIREVIKLARERREPSYIFVNNRLEGNAPGTIEAIID